MNTRFGTQPQRMTTQNSVVICEDWPKKHGCYQMNKIHKGRVSELAHGSDKSTTREGRLHTNNIYLTEGKDVNNKGQQNKRQKGSSGGCRASSRVGRRAGDKRQESGPAAATWFYAAAPPSRGRTPEAHRPHQVLKERGRERHRTHKQPHHPGVVTPSPFKTGRQRGTVKQARHN